jgi:hypothetical protein
MVGLRPPSGRPQRHSSRLTLATTLIVGAQGFAVSALAVLTAVVLGLGGLAELNRERATAERNRALRNQSLLLAGVAHQETDQGNAVAGILLALEALPQDVQHPGWSPRPWKPSTRECSPAGSLRSCGPEGRSRPLG